MKLATWNVWGIIKKKKKNCRKLKRINIAILSETMKTLRRTKVLDGFTIIYSGVDQQKRASSGVAILIDKKWKSRD